MQSTQLSNTIKPRGFESTKKSVSSQFYTRDGNNTSLDMEPFFGGDSSGLSYDTFSDMILKDMRFVVNDSELRILFNMVDRSGNGSISKMEFIQGFHTLMRHLVPNMILNSLSVLPEQIVRHILKALVFLLLLFAFLFVSMDALTPSSADLDYMGGVQAGIAGIAAVGVRFQSTSGMDTTSIKVPSVNLKIQPFCFYMKESGKITPSPFPRVFFDSERKKLRNCRGKNCFFWLDFSQHKCVYSCFSGSDCCTFE